MGYNEKESNSFFIWNPQLHQNNSISYTPALTQLSLPEGIQSLSIDCTEAALEDKYFSVKDILQDVRGETVALDFNIDIPAGGNELDTQVTFD